MSQDVRGNSHDREFAPAWTLLGHDAAAPPPPPCHCEHCEHVRSSPQPRCRCFHCEFESAKQPALGWNWSRVSWTRPR